MIIKIFNQGEKAGDYIVRYLLSKDKHPGFEPEILSGNANITKSIISSLEFKNKYVAGCISFRQEEQLSRSQQFDLMERFEKTFCPFNDRAKVNFLWVKHFDKNRLELNFLIPRGCFSYDGSMKSFNPHPPGKANQLFFESFVRVENLRYGFAQVDGKTMTFQDAEFYANILTDLYAKRKKYIFNNYEKPKTLKRKGSNHGRKSGVNKCYAKYTKFRDLGNGSGYSACSGRSIQQPTNTRSNRYERGFEKIDDDQSTGARRSSINDHGHRVDQAVQPIEDYRKHTNNSIQSILKLMSSKPALPPGLSIDDQILALSVQLNGCNLSDADAIVSQLNYLQGLKSMQGGNGRLE
jgi:hypothetical protein